MRASLCTALSDGSIGRFLAVGLANTLVGLSIIYTSMYVFGVGDAWANASGYIVGIMLSFVLNKRWTFRHTGSIMPALVKFLSVTGIAYMANLSTVLLLTHGFGLNRYLAQAAGIPPYTIVGYLGARMFAFAGEDRRSEA